MGMTVAVNVASGNDWNDGLMQAGLTGFCSGMLQATGLGPVGQAVGQSLITGAPEGYSLWRKSKTEEGITAVDVTLAVVNTVKTGMSGYKHSKKLPREIKECKASTRNYKRAKAGGKEGVIRRIMPCSTGKAYK